MAQNKHGKKTLYGTAMWNNRVYSIIYNQIESMALTRFKWINLPETCDERFLELTLLTQGIATIARPYSGAHKNEWLSLMVGAWQQSPDMYGNPARWSALGVNGYQFNVTPRNGYYCWDNHLRAPIIPRIEIWTRELVDILATMRQNRAHQKIPLILSGVQEKRLDLTNYVKQVAGGELFVLATDGISSLDAKVLTPPNAIPFNGDKLWENFINIWNQIYNSLGIKNLPFKQERMIEDEVQSQTDPTDLVALDELECRRKMCEYLNNNFDEFRAKPLNVVWRSDNATHNYNMLHDLTKITMLEGDDSNGTDTTV